MSFDILDYAVYKKLSGGGGNYQEKSVTPSTSAQNITADTGYDALSSVNVSAITKELLASLDADFVAGNIKKNVDILGLIGTLEAGSGGAKVAVGTITFASDKTTSAIITHDFGVTPDFACIYQIDPKPTAYTTGQVRIAAGWNSSAFSKITDNETVRQAYTSGNSVVVNANGIEGTTSSTHMFDIAGTERIFISFNGSLKAVAGSTYVYIIVALGE